MRFLQIEWHNHERARNAWDIERAEMKAKIAKQEGECRNSKKTQEQLDRQIKMLEKALRVERMKNKGVVTEDNSQPEAGARKLQSKSRPDPKHGKPHNSFLDISDSQSQSSPQAEMDAQRDKSRICLEKCVQEITYLMTPPAHPPPPYLNAQASSAFANQNEAPMSLEEVYIQQRQKGQQQQGQDLPHPSSMLNYQPLSVPSLSDVPNLTHPMKQQKAPQMAREPSGQQLSFDQNQSAPAAEQLLQQSRRQHTSSFPPVPEDQVEKVTHSYDHYGRPIPGRDEEFNVVRSVVNEEPDGWNFDESTNPPEPPPEAPPPRRPDTDLFPSANNIPAKSPPRTGPGSHRRKSSGSSAMTRRRSSGSHESSDASSGLGAKVDHNFKVRFALQGHMDVVRSVIFTGGGSPSEPEICTAGDDGTVKRWIIPSQSYGNYTQHSAGNDLDIPSYFTHRGHESAVLSLAACPASPNFSTGGRASGDGWVFSGGQDCTIRVWERGRVDPKATIDGHNNCVWTVCVLPGTCGSVFGLESHKYGGPDRILLASGSSDGTIKIWSISPPPQLASPHTGSRRGVGGSRRHSVTSGSNFSSSPQPTVATSTPFHYDLIHSIPSSGTRVPTCISPLSLTGQTFVVSFNDSAVQIFDTRTGEEIIGMASSETYDGTGATQINAVVATSVSVEGAMRSMSLDSGRGLSEDEAVFHGATGSSGADGVEGQIITGHEDRYIRIFDANSGQCTYNMIAHPSAIAALSLSNDGREAVSAGHDASIRFWSLEKRICTQEISGHRIMRGEGVCSVVWSQDGRHVVSAGGDGVVKVFSR
ncbi:hypothetical protein LTR04_004179 [Oleoguttula sp. CCFEE 6159]|nr:hypothetical protein LTR04_004179 [Oleoguttula sp. CCFEE 6159]